MNFFGHTNNINNGGREVYLCDDEEYTTPEYPASPVIDVGNVSAGGMGMTVVNPTAFRDVAPIADAVLKGVTVVLGMERVTGDDARRMLDFLSGVIYAINGDLKKVAAATYIISPNGVNLYEAPSGKTDT